MSTSSVLTVSEEGVFAEEAQGRLGVVGHKLDQEGGLWGGDGGRHPVATEPSQHRAVAL